jgi:hypothetical protein
MDGSRGATSLCGCSYGRVMPALEATRGGTHGRAVVLQHEGNGTMDPGVRLSSFSAGAGRLVCGRFRDPKLSPGTHGVAG